MEVYKPIKRSGDFSYKEIELPTRKTFQLLSLKDNDGNLWEIKRQLTSESYQELSRSKSYMEFSFYEVVRPRLDQDEDLPDTFQSRFLAIQAFMMEGGEWKFSILKIDAYRYLVEKEYDKGVQKMQAYIDLPPYLRNRHVIRE